MNKTFFIAAAAFLFAGTAQAALLDFETGYAGNKTAIVGDEFEAAFGVTFSSAGGLNIVEVGGPADGFVPGDTPDPVDAFGSYFLTSGFGTVTQLVIDYTLGASEASFEVGDIDGSGSDLEEFTFVAKDEFGNVLSSQFVDGNDADAGDAAVTKIGFSGLSGLISKIEITGTTFGGTRKIGIAFDNFNTTLDTTTPVPLPAALPLAIAGVGALGFVRSRRKG
ncbi:VPLPA-CTERM sorting domain-containing protein [Meridianimarinicoccus aquatilis]|uniref:VPLPA-CTERM sorting domain-containing protein n=1 Tax=Meridianimarinicoccus aquatilis TaxID=2552766 RepID=A0A4R6AZP0_9RHOB|nr:VPLPA-CTERM sorting domain-containing protein [Fluviibacterium aquatile]QIE41051.1 hypothetical protein G5B39_03180 [Rhodobacteraceae bacterium SC52]TDL89352.1 hypothetical protein E2L05_06800 [Fluviibacterium aquatile]